MLEFHPFPSCAGARTFSPATATLSRDELDARHLRRIRRLIAYAYRHSALHRRIYDAAGMTPRDVRTWDDFHKHVPFTDKADYVADQEERGLAAEAMGPDLISAYFHTTGTTGSFLHEHYSEYDALQMATIYAHAWWDCGVRPGDSIFINHNFGFWLGLWHMYWAARFFGLTIYSAGGMTTDQRLDAILSRRPTMVAGTPTYLMRLAQRAAERGLDLASGSVRYLTAGGEPGMNVPVTRRALEAAWGAVGIDAYGLSEVGVAHVECGAHPGGVHVMEDVFHAYSVDHVTGAVIPDGEVGENIVTSYSHLAQPFIKYRTHDLVRRYARPNHACNWTWAYLDGGVLGRTDFMVVVKGVNVYPTAIENLIGAVAGLTGNYELHIRAEDGTDRIRVRVEAEAGAEDGGRAALGERLVAVYRERLGVALEVEVLPYETLERFELKTKRIFDHRRGTGAPG